jgi:hypothetical protein
MTRSIFSLDQARALLPQVKLLTADAVIRAEAISAELQHISEADPAHGPLTETLREIVDTWTAAVRALGPEAKGLWLVDFDNGEGYYCWRYPETGIAHYHGYEDGFAGRIPIQ